MKLEFNKTSVVQGVSQSTSGLQKFITEKP